MKNDVNKGEFSTRNDQYYLKRDQPPLGVTPKTIHDQQVKTARFNELREAIMRYCEAGLPLKPEWVEEYDQTVKSMQAKVYTFNDKPYKIFYETKVKIDGFWMDAVIYQALYHNPDGEFWVRTKKEFFELFKTQTSNTPRPPKLKCDPSTPSSISF